MRSTHFLFGLKYQKSDLLPDDGEDEAHVPVFFFLFSSPPLLPLLGTHQGAHSGIHGRSRPEACSDRDGGGDGWRARQCGGRAELPCMLAHTLTYEAAGMELTLALVHVY